MPGKHGLGAVGEVVRERCPSPIGWEKVAEPDEGTDLWFRK